jgi:glutathione synthase/RimK-type ligase-like ATP-grasp enzyme
MPDSPAVALFGKVDDAQLLAVRDAVRAEGGRPLVLPLRVGGAGGATLTCGRRFAWNGTDLTRVRSAYLRALAPNTLPALPPVMNAAMRAEWRARYLREQEVRAAVDGFFETWEATGACIANPPVRYIHHDTKPQFYERLAAAGLRVPETLTTNDPDRVRAFLRTHGTAVVKPAIGVGSTRLLHRSDRPRLEEVRRAPVMLQRRIKGPTLRLHVVADTLVLALRVLGDAVDSRTETKGFEPASVPPDEAEGVVRATRLLGMRFAAWDAIRDRSGRLWLLDANPGPFVMWIGGANVRAVFTQLARYLVSYARHRDESRASRSVTQCE